MLPTGTGRIDEGKDTKVVKKRRENVKTSTAGMKYRSLDGLTIVRAYRPLGWLLPRAVDELPN